MGMRLKWKKGRQKEEGEEEGTKPRPHTAFVACAMKCTHTAVKPKNIARATPMVM